MTLDEHNYFQMHKKEDYGTNLKTVFHDLSLQYLLDGSWLDRQAAPPTPSSSWGHPGS